MDPCFYFLRCNQTKRLIGVMGVHVDDTALGGDGPQFEQTLSELRQRFLYRKWIFEHITSKIQNPRVLKCLRRLCREINREPQLGFVSVSARFAASNEIFPTTCSQTNYPKFERCKQCHCRANSMKFHPIPPENLSICCHSDAAWANESERIKAGLILAFAISNHPACGEPTNHT